MADLSDLDFAQTVRGLRAGQTVCGRYTLQRILGRGGMGVVWLATDDRLEREVALKFLPEVIAHDRMALNDLMRETRRALTLTHENIVRIFDLVEDRQSSIAAISMEYVDGDNLSHLRLEKPDVRFAPAELAPYLRQLCLALEYAHQRARVVHRDLKPANLMVTKEGDLKVTDFGIARSLTDSASRASATQGGSSGTLVYMSPQQALGEPSTPADDIYSLGATLYDLLTSRPPFYSGNIYEQLRSVAPPTMAERCAQLGHETPAVIPPEWEETVAACLAKDPAQRPASVREIGVRLGLLNAAQPGLPPAGAGPQVVAAPPMVRVPRPAEKGSDRKPTGMILTAAAVLLLLLGGGGWYWWQQQQSTPATLPAASLPAAPAPSSAAADQADQAAEDRMAAERAEKASAPLELATEPPGATVKLGATVLGQTPLAGVAVPVGAHTLYVEAPGFDPAEQRVQIEEGKGINLGTLPLKRSLGAAQLETTPPGQSYTLRLVEGDVANEARDVRFGTTPATSTGLRTGKYEVIFERSGWPPHTTTLQVQANQVAEVKHAYVEAEVTFTSEPPGAVVEMAPLAKGQWSMPKVGTTPFTFRGAPGEYFYRLEMEPWQSSPSQVKLAGGPNPGISTRFATGSLRVTSAQAGVPFVLMPVTSAYFLQSRALAERLNEYRAAGGTQARSKVQSEIMELQRSLAKLEEAGQRGQTPATLEKLPTCEYTVVFQPPGEKAFRVGVDVVADREARVTMTASGKAERTQRDGALEGYEDPIPRATPKPSVNKPKPTPAPVKTAADRQEQYGAFQREADEMKRLQKQRQKQLKDLEKMMSN